MSTNIIMIVVLIIATISLLLTPLFKLSSKSVENLRIAASVMIMLTGIKILESIFNFSWLVALIATSIYLVTVILITKNIATQKQKINK